MTSSNLSNSSTPAPTSSLARPGRRRFLGTSAATAATAAWATGSALAQQPAGLQDGERHGGLRTVGVLLPDSSRYPTLSAEFMAGLEAGAQASRHAAPRWHPLPYGHSAHAAVRQARAAVESGAVDALAGWLPMQSATELVPILEQRGIPLLASDTGADRLPVHRHAKSPLLIPHTLELWQSSALMGREAVRRWGTRAVLCMGFLESGYDFPHEFRRAFEAAGGTIVAVHISGLPGGVEEFAGLRSALHGAQADVAVALYSGQQALRFQQQWSRLRPNARQPVLGTPFTQGPAVASVDPLKGWASVASWDARSDACQAIAAQCAARGASQSAGLSGPALLGFEAGQRFAEWQNRADSAQRLHALRGSEGDSPRGTRLRDPSSGESSGPHWLHAGPLQAGATTQLSHAMSGSALAQEAPGRSGWSSSYLVT